MSYLSAFCFRFSTAVKFGFPAVFIYLFSCSTNTNPGQTAEKAQLSVPKVLDERLELHLFAEDSSIVTPIGIAIDTLNRIFVLESHTHLPPKDYKGPKSDRVKIFVDDNGDGTPDKISVFAEGLKEGLNMAFSPEGHLYVVTSRAVWILYDRNKDGISEEKIKAIELVEPDKVYAHAALLGITFSHDGWMYISRGNTGGAAWKMVGTDSSWVSGYGDGGNIVRARLDGSNLQEVATGFWNPVDLKFDERGRLLAADNDPDSRGPNRLVHVVEGGDYGYQSLYGGSGIHPYLAWNGELAGTLPYAVGVGEAPSGLLNASLAALPKDYRGQMLCSIWEESRIVRVDLSQKGVSLTGHTEVIVEGNEHFRPVAFATDRNGAIYFTDWVLRDYPNHGKGRIWKLSARPGTEVNKPVRPYAKPLPDSASELLKALYDLIPPQGFDQLTLALQSDDPFLRHAAIMKLTQPAYQQQVVEATHHPDPEVRLGATIALQRSGYAKGSVVVRYSLDDQDVRVRQSALMWVGKEGMIEEKLYINKALNAGVVTPALFETYLETVRHLDPDFIQAYHNRSENYAKSLKRNLPPHFIASFVNDKAKPAALRALAIRHLEHPEQHMSLLNAILAKEKDTGLRLEAIRSMANLLDQEVAGQLLKVATVADNPGVIRAEALLALSRQPTDMSTGVIGLLNDADEDIQIEAARYLRLRVADESVKNAFMQKYATLNKSLHSPVQEQIEMALAIPDAKRPASVEEWQNLLTAGGNPERGRRVLFTVQAMCTACHTVAGRGGDLGPDLSNTGKSKTRMQLANAILYPSEEVSPEYQGWYIRLTNGELHQGRQIDIGGNSIELYTQGQGFITFEKQHIEDYGLVKKSLMPEGLEKQLTASDFRDLVAFLEGRPNKLVNGR